MGKHNIHFMVLIIVMTLLINSCTCLQCRKTNESSIDAANIDFMDINRKAIVKDFILIAKNAIEYYKTPVNEAGGQGSYIGWAISPALLYTRYAKYIVVKTKKDELTISGIGFVIGVDGTTCVKLTLQVSQLNYSITINN
jgi:hypothetical protein